MTGEGAAGTGSVRAGTSDGIDETVAATGLGRSTAGTASARARETTGTADPARVAASAGRRASRPGRADEAGRASRVGRPDADPRLLAMLGVLAALRALGLVLLADAVAQGIAGLAAGEVDARAVLMLGAAGAAVRAGAGWATEVVARRGAVDAKKSLRLRLWRRILRGGDAGGGTAVLASDGLDDLDDYYVQTLPAMVGAAVVPLAVGLRIAGADWFSAIVIVLTIPLVPLFMILIGRHTQQHTDRATASLTRLADHLAELARGLPVLVGLGRVDEQTRALDAIQRDYRERTQATLRTAFLSALALELIATISVAVVAVFLGLRLMQGSVTLEAALIALILAPECYAALRDVGAAFHASQAGIAALERVRELLRRPLAPDVRTGGAVRGVTEARAGDAGEAGAGEAGEDAARGEGMVAAGDGLGDAGVPAVHGTGGAERGTGAGEAGADHDAIDPDAARADGESADAGTGGNDARGEGIVAGDGWGGAGATAAVPAPRVRIRGLAVSYADRSVPVLDGIDAELSGITAVSGPSGCGKSTLLAALTGTLPEGARVAGSIHGAGAAGWAPQAPRTFTATPREELELFGSADPGSALAELGLRSIAGASTAELSPGELRRLAVARALARVDAGARLLVLDEPTAHLDAAAATRVRDAIRRRAGRAAVVLASHEPATLALAGRTVDVGASAAVLRMGEAPSRSAAAVGDAPGGALAQQGRAGRSGGAASSQPEQPPTDPAESTADDPVPSGTGPGAAPAELGTAPKRAAGRLLQSLIRPVVRQWLGAVALGVLATGLGLALTAVSGWLIVRASEEEHIMYLLVAIVGVRFFGLGRSVGRYAERLATHAAVFRMVDALRLRLWRAIAARGAGSRRLLEGGTPLDYLVTLADELRDRLPRVIPPVAVGALSIAGITVTVAFVVPQLATATGLTLTAAAVAGAALAVLAARRAERTGVAARSALVRGSARLSSASPDLRGNGCAEAALERLRTTGDELAQAERRAARASGAGVAVVAFATGMLAIGAPLLAGDLPAERVAVAALLALAAFEPLAALVTAAGRGPGLGELLTRLAQILEPEGRARRADRDDRQGARALDTPDDEPRATASDARDNTRGPTAADALDNEPEATARPRDDGPETTTTGARDNPAAADARTDRSPTAAHTRDEEHEATAPTGDDRPDPIRTLTLDGLAAGYPGSDTVFTGIDAEVRTGERLVVTGPSGSGKSTLLSVLMGALPPRAGEVRADGIPVDRIGTDRWRRHVAWCPQEAHVFDSTLRGNLLLARGRDDPASEDELTAALHLAGLGELLTALPDGLDTRVGSAGSSLSGGERQRLAVARALLTRADVILLDEPTAHLDAPTAEAMMRDIERATRERIVILVTHRDDGRREGDLLLRLGAREPAVSTGHRAG